MDREDKSDVGLSSEDEAEGLGPEAGVAQRGQSARVGQPGRGRPHSIGRRRGDSQVAGPQEGEAAGVISPKRGRPARRGQGLQGGRGAIPAAYSGKGCHSVPCV